MLVISVGNNELYYSGNTQYIGEIYHIEYILSRNYLDY